MRGTFGNIRLRNALAEQEGPYTTYQPDGTPMFLYDASMHYQREGTPLVILAGTEYGSGSSRDWAAKGTRLLGVRAVIAQSYERIHRSNLVGMGVLPLQFLPGQSAASLGLDGREAFDITGLGDGLTPRAGAGGPAQRPPTGDRDVPGRVPARRTHRAGLLPPGWHPAGRPAQPGRDHLTIAPARSATTGGRARQGILPADRRHPPVSQRLVYRSMPTR